MNSEQAPFPSFVAITKYLPLAEKFLLTALAVGIVLVVMKIDSVVVAMSLLGLGTIYFLYSYRPINVPAQDGVKPGFLELLGLGILPKVLWISSSVCAVGIVFYLLGFFGYDNMLMIGAMSVGMGILLLGLLLALGVKHLVMVAPVLLRAVPLCLATLYILIKH